MRRLLAFVLLLAFGVPGVTPLFALSADGDAGVPACCRKTGAHGCSRHQHDQGTGDQITVVAPKCPCCPGALPMSHPVPAGYGAVGTALVGMDGRPASVVQTEARARVSAGRSHQKRGPPVLV